MKKNQKKKSTPEKHAVAYSLTRKGMLTWFCLIFFICAWMFLLGVLVGRGTAPVRFDISALHDELADLRRAVIKKEEKRYKINKESDSARPELGFYEILKKKKGNSDYFTKGLAEFGKTPIPKKLKPMKASALPDAGPNKSKTSLKKQTFKTKPVKRSTQQPGVVDKVAEKQSVGNFIIQVASTRDPKDADRMAAALKAGGYQAYRVSASIPGKGTWHRVRVGGFQTRAAGEIILKQLKKGGFDGLLLKR